jgi:hypothetical protein
VNSLVRSGWVASSIFIIIIGALAGIGCASVQEKIPFVGGRYRTRNEGYSLLYELITKQRDVDKILILKHASGRTATEIKEIAQTFRQAQERFDAFARQDSSLSFKAEHLPSLEVKARDSIQSTSTKNLLFSTGKDFELRLLLTQAQALDYVSHLAVVLEDREDNKQRALILDEFSKQCDQHYKNVLQLLSSL